MRNGTSGVRIAALVVIGLLLLPCALAAAVGCSLTDPDRDIKRMFPQSTGYKTSFVTLKERSAGRRGAGRGADAEGGRGQAG